MFLNIRGECWGHSSAAEHFPTVFKVLGMISVVGWDGAFVGKGEANLNFLNIAYF